ncbi:hypothetical protein LSM04_007417 [Trypanosoma melophagium]|uniref:uncharacterized protein n=1 Tax=Trypanosoma melophagium TaxID=715481 RepID=UPI00351A504F|nr:hypothetical protein LSM04_007417 [Trypanosoma melophagium]
MNFLGDLSENASSLIFRLLQMHADRVRALREEEATSIARAELLEQLTERLLYGDFSADEVAQLSPTTSLEVSDSQRVFDRPNLSAPEERECNVERLVAVSSDSTDEDRKQHEQQGDDEEEEEEEDQQEENPIASVSQDVSNDILADTIEDKIPDNNVKNRTPSPMRRELEAFFPVLATKRPRQSSATDDMHYIRKRDNVTATDILASVPCISSRAGPSTIQTDATIHINEAKSHVRTNRRRQIDYAADEAMHIRDENAPIEVCTPPPFWEIGFPQSRQA